MRPAASVENILQLFKKGTVHCAIVTKDPENMVREASAVVHYICSSEEQRTEKFDQMNSTLGKHKHDVLGLVTMERLIESILSIHIMDEKDTENLNDSCATSMMNQSAVSNFSVKRINTLNLTKVSEEIDNAMNGSVSMKDIPKEDR